MKREAENQSLTPSQRAHSRAASFLAQATRIIETGVTTAALYLLRGTSNYFSHSFERVNVYNIFSYLENNSYDCVLVPAPGPVVDASLEFSSDEDSDDDNIPQGHTATVDAPRTLDIAMPSLTLTCQTQPQGFVATVPAILDYAERGLEVLVDMCYYDFLSEVQRRKIVSNSSPRPASRLDVAPQHPLNASHCLVMRTAVVVPLVVGKRIPSKACFDDDDASDDQTYYIKYAMAMYKPWSSRNPLRAPGQSWAAAFACWDRSERADSMLLHEQNYYDNQRLARNGSRDESNLIDDIDECDADNPDTAGLNVDSEDDNDVEAAALAAAAAATPGRPVSTKLAEFLGQVGSTGDMPSMPEARQNIVTACLACIQPTDPADWLPTSAAAKGGESSGDSNSAVSTSTELNRSALVTAAFAQTAAASSTMQRITTAGKTHRRCGHLSTSLWGYFMTHQWGVWTFVHIFLGDIFMTHQWGCGHLSTSFWGIFL